MPGSAVVARRQVQLGCEDVGEDAHALRVAAGALVVCAQRRQQTEDARGSLTGRLIRMRTGPLLEDRGLAGCPGHLEPRGGMVREQHRHAQQRRERQHLAEDAFGHQPDDHRERTEGHEPAGQREAVDQRGGEAGHEV